MGKRYNAKRIAKSPALKRKIAEILAQHHNEISKETVTIQHMLAYGHRGYISYNETDLCKMFDKLFTTKLADADERKKEIAERKINPHHPWEVRNQEQELAKIETSLGKFREIADELFEAQFLS